jgi:hypothetical protein
MWLHWMPFNGILQAGNKALVNRTMVQEDAEDAQ